MATTQELLDAVDAAIAGNAEGVLEHEVRGRKVRYMSLTELLKARGILAARLQREQEGMVAGIRLRPPD